MDVNLNLDCQVCRQVPCTCTTRLSPTCAPPPMFTPMPPPCLKCGWSHTTATCMMPIAPRLSDADVERVALRVVELLDRKSRKQS